MVALFAALLAVFGLIPKIDLPLGVPIIFEGLHVMVGAMQSYIFIILTTVYLAGAVADEH